MKSTWLMCFYAFIVAGRGGGGAALSFMTVTFYDKNPQYFVCDGKYDFIFVQTKSAEVGLFMNITIN